MPSLRQFINLFFARGIRVDYRPLSFYVEKLSKGEPFSFARYGDGEWSAILGREGANCDGHEYFPALGDALRAAVETSGGYFYAMQTSALRDMGRCIAGYLRRCDNAPRQWFDADVFHRASAAGELFPLIRQLRAMRLVVVGPAHLRSLGQQARLPCAHFIEVPSRNCFRAVDDIRCQVLEYGKGRRGVVFSLSASMAANVIIHDVFSELGHANWLIDFGSLWDAYVGVFSRGYQREGTFDAMRRRNLGG